MVIGEDSIVGHGIYKSEESIDQFNARRILYENVLRMFEKMY